MPLLRDWTRDDVRPVLRAPGASDDKRSRGVVALLTGSPAYPGAAVLGVSGAWRAGAGYVRYLGEGAAADAVVARRPETVVSPPRADDLPRVDAWVVGSGTDPAHRTEDEAGLLRTILRGSAPVVVDAGALDLIATASAPTVATPHAGELSRLIDQLGLAPVDPDTLRSDDGARAAAAAEVAAAADVVVLLKGARTLVAAPGEEPVLVSSESTGWLATAGTGDVLAGVLGALIAANPAVSLSEVAASGAWVHGRAGRIAADAVDDRPGHPIVALDVADALPRAIEGILA
ncbi:MULTISPECIES: ADP-dependent NAD(P)H-hydrate dehydratase [Bacteria]|uniref:ADP-dependent NAD(P)H-hydrate dehydratase n=1 Tax=Bacteria TaxID=2 RepID=UPI003C7CFF55